MPFDPTTATLDSGGTFDPKTASKFDPTTAQAELHGSFLERNQQANRQTEQLFEQKTGKKKMDDPVGYAGFALTNPEAQKLGYETIPSMGPGEGLMRSRPSLFKGPAPPQAQIVKKATDAGYTLPPRLMAEYGVERGTVTKGLEAYSGKYKLEQEASQTNQALTNQKAARGLGLAPDTLLIKNVFDNVRKESWQKYLEVSRALPQMSGFDESFVNDLVAMGARRKEAAKAFPKTLHNPDIESLTNRLFDDFVNKPTVSTDAALELVRQLRGDSSLNIKNMDAGKRALGYAQRQAADAVDNLIERRLGEAGVDPSVMQNYRNARQRIAISHDLEAATNTGTGDVSAHAIASLADKGRPLSGELQEIAEIASAFPRATRFVSQFGGTEPWSVLDFAYAAAGATHGNYGMVGTVLGRPLARKAVLSKPYQRHLTDTLSGQPPAMDFLTNSPTPALNALQGGE